jgi:hypothetical protein
VSAGSSPLSPLFVERFPELLTGWPMLGIGADWAMPTTGDLQLRVTYDGSTRIEVRITPDTSGYRFGFQIPVESQAKRLDVIVYGEQVLAEYHGDLAEVPWRGSTTVTDSHTHPSHPLR